MCQLKLVFFLALWHLSLGLPVELNHVEQPSSPTSDTHRREYRLPNNVVPSEYQIRIKPYLNTNDSRRFTFEGTTTIKFRVRVSGTNIITLHENNLSLTKSPVLGPTQANITVSSEEKYDFLRLSLRNLTLSTNTDYTLTFAYVGEIRDDVTGFYRNNYTEGDETKWMASTHLQPYHARKVFPCFDEPEFKAVFKLVIECPQDYACISNTKSTVNEGNVHTFQPTPRMSTYLLAFVVAQYTRATGNLDTGVWTRPQAGNQVAHITDHTDKAIKELEKYTGVPYWTQHSDPNIKLKMDQAAVPEFSSGAMENWGLIIYRETSFLVSSTESTTLARQRSTALITHELAHMWFGNLVTCHWWSDTWLNEGFAQYHQYFSTDKVSPSFGLSSQFIVTQLQLALSIDASSSSPPLTYPLIDSPEEISRHFGTISYQKGASIIRMMQYWIGENVFKAGLKAYLTNYKHNTVTPTNLFSDLQSAANSAGSISIYNKTVKEVFESWTLKSGYPLLRVGIDKTSKIIYAKQERFVKEGQSPTLDKYMIPITYTTENEVKFTDTKPQMIMSSETISLGKLKNRWIILNIQQTGFYRVLYSDELYGHLIRYMSKNASKIHEYNRAQIVDDAFNFAREGKMNYSLVLDITKFLKKEKSYTPWASAMVNINALRDLFIHFERLSSEFDKYLRSLMNTVVNDLGFTNNGNDLRKVFRASVMNLACDIKREDCLNYTTRTFRNWVQSNTAIFADHREFVYCNGLRYSTDYRDFDILWEKYEKEQVVSEKLLVLKALGCTKNQTQIIRYLLETLEPNSKVRLQDKVTVFSSAVAGNKENVATTWAVFIENYSIIRRIYGQQNLQNIMEIIVSRMNHGQLDWFEWLLISLGSALPPNSPENIHGKTILANARNNLAWVSKKEAEILDWISRNRSSSKTINITLTLFTSIVLWIFNCS